MRLILALYALLLVASAPTLMASNPFTPPENIRLFYEVLYPDPSSPKIEYKMYMQSAGKDMALLNGSLVAEGDKFENMTVSNVNSKRVVLLSPDGQKRIVLIDAMQSTVQQLRALMNEGNE